MLTPILTNADGTLPSPLQSYPAQGEVSQAYNAVDRTTRALLVQVVAGGALPAGGGLATAANQVLQLAKTPALGVAGTQSVDFISTQGKGYKGTATITRAANQTPYTIGDVIGGAFAIAGAGPISGDILLTSIRFLYNVTALPSGLQNLTLQVYGATPPSAIADNSPWTLGSGDRAAYIGHIDNIPVAALGIGTQTVQGQLDNIIQQFLCDSSGQLFGYLIANQAFTPAGNSETISFVTLGILP